MIKLQWTLENISSKFELIHERSEEKQFPVFYQDNIMTVVLLLLLHHHVTVLVWLFDNYSGSFLVQELE